MFMGPVIWYNFSSFLINASSLDSFKKLYKKLTFLLYVHVSAIFPVHSLFYWALWKEYSFCNQPAQDK